MNKSCLISTVLSSFLLAGSLGDLPDIDSNIAPININQIVNDSNTTEVLFAPNDVIVRFKDDANISQMIGEVASMFAGATTHKYSIIKGIHISLPNMEHDTIKTMLENSNLSGMIESIDKNYAYKPMTSNDSYYDKLWALENTGQDVNGKTGTSDADMDVREAWDKTDGSSSVVVAVLDTGVDYTHDDLTDNMWSSSNLYGYDFAGDDNGNNDDDPMPDMPYDENGHYHGTHVAGTIGAVGDNNLGVTGIAKNVQIMAVKVFRPNGYGYSSDILEGLDYVSDQVDNGVNIVAINASYGGGNGSRGDSTDKAIQKLGDKGVVFCAAAGNDGKDIDSDPVYPASYSASNIITVAASDQDDKLASFSNYGKDTVEVAAPGTNILSTYPEDKYAYLNGTSMATPNVVGTVALLAAVNPDSTVSERIRAIIDTVDVKSSLSNKVSTNGRVNTNGAITTLDDGSGPDNTAPDAKNDSATTDYETQIIINALSNDSDVDDDTLTIKSVSSSDNGTAIIKNNKIEYTPKNNFSGNDSFSYTISDGNGGEGSANIYVKVNEKPNTIPEAKNDNAEVEYETQVIIDVLGNDGDADGDVLTIKSVSSPDNGTAIIKNNKIEYTPKNNFSGNDSFSYIISDGNGGEDSATVAVEVKVKTNTAPDAKNDSATTDYETKIIINVLSNDSDADGDALTIKSVSSPDNGTAIIKNNKIEYTPKNNFSGNDSFSYTVSDGNDGEDTARIGIKVEKQDNNDGVNHSPIANSDMAYVTQGAKVIIDPIKNDSDKDGDRLSLSSVTQPAHGGVRLVNNKVEYKADAYFVGKDTFNYTITDEKGAIASAKITVTVKEKKGDGYDFSFPIIGDKDTETHISIFDNFTKKIVGEKDIFALEDVDGTIEVNRYNGSVTLKNMSVPVPNEELSAGTELELQNNKMKVKFRLTEDVQFALGGNHER